ncbi:MAG: DUF6067 family protein [Kiritimatiellaeota bacterium]|nr:DUF6067 family protein [Kiritimatiellota bacterium]
MVAVSVVAQSKEPFEAFAFYLPYGQVFRVSYRLSPQEWEKTNETTKVAITLTASNGKEVFAETKPVMRDVNLDWSAYRERGDGEGLQYKLPLAEDVYQAIMLLTTDNEVVYAKTNAVTVKKFAFEHNTIGLERVVVPPFTPITTSLDSASVWGRTFSFDSSGLPLSIDVLGKNILFGDGIRLQMKQDGKIIEPKVSKHSFLKTTDGYDATGSFAGTLGGLSYSLEARLEYDGSCFYRLTLDNRIHGQTAIPMDSLTLLIPLAPETDTYSFQRNDRDTRTAGGLSRFAGISPKADGIIWDARELPRQSAYGLTCDNCFIPAIYVGTGSRGLWYYADSDWDWYLNPEGEHATLERVNGQTQLRILLVNDTLEWTGKRVFEFVLMPQPVKPMPSGWRKVAWGYPKEQYIHDTSGWRYYGDGINAFTLPTDEDYIQLGKVFWNEAAPPVNVNGQPNRRNRDDTRPYVLYGSSLMAGTGIAQGEWEVYGAEWAGVRDITVPLDPGTRDRFMKGAQDKGFDNPASYGGFQWTEPLSYGPAALQWSDSWVDFFIYYHHKLVTLAGVNGTWFDNQPCFTYGKYTDDGFEQRFLDNPNRWQPPEGDFKRTMNYGRAYHILQFRTLLKRLSTLCHTAGVQPFWLVNQHPTWSFGQFAWHIEGDWYADRSERDLVEHLGVEGFRAHLRTQGGVIPRLQFAGHSHDYPPREGHPETLGVRLFDGVPMTIANVDHTHVGLCLLHDSGAFHGAMPLLKKLDEQFGFFDDTVTFHPYWEQDTLTTDSDRVFVSVFRNPAKGRSIAVLFNEKKSPRGLTVSLRGEQPRSNPAHEIVFRDLESGEPVTTHLYIPPRNFRILIW